MAMRACVLSLIFCFSFSASAIDAVATAIEQAQALAIKKNRVDACAILNRTWQELPSNSKARLKVGEALGQISKMFFTDKGQKIFEAGQSLMWDTYDLAFAQFKEALVLEDQNIQILNNVARIQMIKQDCDGAIQTLFVSRKLNPIDGEGAVLELRALICKASYATFREKVKNLPTLNKWEESYVQYLSASEDISQKNFKRAYDILSKIIEEHPQFPESYLLLSKIAEELNKDPETYSPKYVSLCKAVTVREKKKFALEPRLCAALKETEDELAKKKTP